MESLIPNPRVQWLCAKAEASMTGLISYGILDNSTKFPRNTWMKSSQQFHRSRKKPGAWFAAGLAWKPTDLNILRSIYANKNKRKLRLKRLKRKEKPWKTRKLVKSPGKVYLWRSMIFEFLFMKFGSLVCSFDQGPCPTKNDSVDTQISNFLAWMKIFMENNQSKNSTFENYRQHMKRMLNLWIKKGLSSVYALWNLNETDLIPVCDSYVDTIDGEPSKEKAINSYKKVKNLH